ncbi:hypothetical protein SNE40_004566 [Patella caerulea]|uniref:Uncharacterized protein n=1 Tax=Patella caerulea TaxID=87958 RepID=A0AAN8K9R9_PATCE
MNDPSIQSTMETMLEWLEKADLCWQRALDQVDLLQDKLCDLKARCDRAKATNFKSLQYVLKQRILITEKVLKMYDLYADVKADQVFNLRIFLMLNGHDFDNPLIDDIFEEIIEAEYGEDWRRSRY